MVTIVKSEYKIGTDPVAYLINAGVPISVLDHYRDIGADISEVALSVSATRDLDVSFAGVPAWEEYKLELEDETPFTGNELLSSIQTLDQFEEREAEWLVDGKIPLGAITLLSADGGVGKTSIWCDLASAISVGKASVLDDPEVTREPAKVLFFSAEDSVSVTLKRKMSVCGANMKNIVTPHFTTGNGLLQKIKFGSKELKDIIEFVQPKLVVFDPLQSFLPDKVKLSERNMVRNALNPIAILAEQMNLAVLIVLHTNKSSQNSGRKRMADSADLWDISRSVLMCGETDEQDIRYISHEKSNYSRLSETVLYTMTDSGTVQRTGTTWKKDRDYVGAVPQVSRPSKLNDCSDFIITTLKENEGKILTKELEDMMKEKNFSSATIRRAKDELKKDGSIYYINRGNQTEKKYFTCLTKDLLEAD